MRLHHGLAWFTWCALLACAAPQAGRHAALSLPPVPSAPQTLQDDHALLSGQLALARGQRALARGEYAVAEEELMRACHTMPGNAPARLGLAEAWLMLGLAERRAVRLEQARHAVEGAVLLAPADDRAIEVRDLIDGALGHLEVSAASR